MEKIILIGGGGHCASVIDSMKKQALYEPVGIFDVLEKVGQSTLGVPIVGTDEEIKNWKHEGITHAFITMGSVGNTKLREKLVRNAEELGFSFPIVIDPSAIVGENVEITSGTYIGKGAIINTNSIIAEHAIINSGVIVEHDCQIGKFVHLAPGTTLSGGVSIGNYSHIGTNSTIIQGAKIGSRTLVGAGSVVLRPIGDGQTAYGNPCKEVK
nr:acetyltransferase [uncultured Trichococcus sp.]